MGDVVSLVERAQEQFDEDEARKIQRKKDCKMSLVLISCPKFSK
jgi:signal recognition particle GTPase